MATVDGGVLSPEKRAAAIRSELLELRRVIVASRQFDRDKHYPRFASACALYSAATLYGRGSPLFELLSQSHAALLRNLDRARTAYVEYTKVSQPLDDFLDVESRRSDRDTDERRRIVQDRWDREIDEVKERAEFYGQCLDAVRQAGAETTAVHAVMVIDLIIKDPAAGEALLQDYLTGHAEEIEAINARTQADFERTGRYELDGYDEWYRKGETDAIAALEREYLAARSKIPAQSRVRLEDDVEQKAAAYGVPSQMITGAPVADVKHTATTVDNGLVESELRGPSGTDRRNASDQFKRGTTRSGKTYSPEKKDAGGEKKNETATTPRAEGAGDSKSSVQKDDDHIAAKQKQRSRTDRKLAKKEMEVKTAGGDSDDPMDASSEPDDEEDDGEREESNDKNDKSKDSHERKRSRRSRLLSPATVGKLASISPYAFSLFNAYSGYQFGGLSGAATGLLPGVVNLVGWKVFAAGKAATMVLSAASFAAATTIRAATWVPLRPGGIDSHYSTVGATFAQAFLFAMTMSSLQRAARHISRPTAEFVRWVGGQLMSKLAYRAGSVVDAGNWIAEKFGWRSKKRPSSTDLFVDDDSARSRRDAWRRYMERPRSKIGDIFEIGVFAAIEVAMFAGRYLITMDGLERIKIKLYAENFLSSIPEQVKFKNAIEQSTSLMRSLEQSHSPALIMIQGPRIDEALAKFGNYTSGQELSMLPMPEFLQIAQAAGLDETIRATNLIASSVRELPAPQPAGSADTGAHESERPGPTAPRVLSVVDGGVAGPLQTSTLQQQQQQKPFVPSVLVIHGKGSSALSLPSEYQGRAVVAAPRVDSGQGGFKNSYKLATVGQGKAQFDLYAFNDPRTLREAIDRAIAIQESDKAELASQQDAAKNASGSWWSFNWLSNAVSSPEAIATRELFDAKKRGELQTPPQLEVQLLRVADLTLTPERDVAEVSHEPYVKQWQRLETFLGWNVTREIHVPASYSTNNIDYYTAGIDAAVWLMKGVFLGGSIYALFGAVLLMAQEKSEAKFGKQARQHVITRTGLHILPHATIMAIFHALLRIMDTRAAVLPLSTNLKVGYETHLGTEFTHNLVLQVKIAVAIVQGLNFADVFDSYDTLIGEDWSRIKESSEAARGDAKAQQESKDEQARREYTEMLGFAKKRHAEVLTLVEHEVDLFLFRDSNPAEHKLLKSAIEYMNECMQAITDKREPPEYPDWFLTEAKNTDATGFGNVIRDWFTNHPRLKNAAMKTLMAISVAGAKQKAMMAAARERQQSREAKSDQPAAATPPAVAAAATTFAAAAAATPPAVAAAETPPAAASAAAPRVAVVSALIDPEMNRDIQDMHRRMQQRRTLLPDNAEEKSVYGSGKNLSLPAAFAPSPPVQRRAEIDAGRYSSGAGAGLGLLPRTTAPKNTDSRSTFGAAAPIARPPRFSLPVSSAVRAMAAVPATIAAAAIPAHAQPAPAARQVPQSEAKLAVERISLAQMREMY